MSLTAANWNKIADPLDKEVWDRLTSNFWLPEKVPVANDVKSWNTLTEEEKTATDKIFAGLTILDTLQSEVGALVLHEDAEDHIEKAVFSNLQFMEAVHAKSYSNIFSTLRSSDHINELFDWVNTDPHIRFKIDKVQAFYQHNSELCSEEYSKALRKAASVILESFLFYSGFYLPMKFASLGKLTNTADIIRLIMRDEGVHGFYIGYKFQQARQKLSEAEVEKLDKAIEILLKELYENELAYTEKVYNQIGWTAGVKKYLAYNANKAMMNLGYPPFIPEEDAKPEAVILSAMSIDANETHDFFSGSGSSYVVGRGEETDDDDWS